MNRLNEIKVSPAETFAIRFSETTKIEGPGYYSILHGDDWSRTHKEKNFIRTRLEVVVLPNENPTSTWLTELFTFESASGKQVLIIDLDILRDEETGTPLYHLDHITCDEGELVGRIFHQTSPVLSNPKHPLVRFPEGTTSIGIEFKMSSKTTTPPFKFSVYVRKTGTTELHDADPQVGNDPPISINPPPSGP